MGFLINPLSIVLHFPSLCNVTSSTTLITFSCNFVSPGVLYRRDIRMQTQRHINFKGFARSHYFRDFVAACICEHVATGLKPHPSMPNLNIATKQQVFYHSDATIYRGMTHFLLWSNFLSNTSRIKKKFRRRGSKNFVYFIGNWINTFVRTFFISLCFFNYFTF